MKVKSQKVKVETVEFALSNQSRIVFDKLQNGWRVTKYKHGHNHRTILVLHLPTITNALYFDEKLKLTPSDL